MNEQEIMDISEAANFLRLSENQIRELCRTRSQMRQTVPLPFFKYHAKAIRFRRSALLEYLDKISGRIQ